MFDMLKSFPYDNPREIQKEALRTLDKHWKDYDVFVLSAPTAFGKTAVAKTIMNAHHSVSVITPTNLLVQQFLQEFPQTCTLSRLDSYQCDEWKRPCSVTRNRLLKFCKGCKAGGDLATALYRRGPGVYNYHTYLAHKLHREVLVVDEAHNLIPVIRERMALRIWQHDLKYPHNMWKPEQIKQWIETLPENKRKGKKIKSLYEAVSYKCPEYVAERTTDMFNGKGTIRGEPEERDCIKLLPVDISGAPPMFWGQGVKKIVLLSATISKKDIEALGLMSKRVLYIDCKSPIAAENRPIIFDPVAAVNRAGMERALPILVDYINNVAAYHEGQKGVIHATYQLASTLREHLHGPRYMFHDRNNKADVYKQFRDSPPQSGRILVASGLYEGIDLPEDSGRWQVIAKVPWSSLANPGIKHLAELDPEWYNWECAKTFIQACGRICRTPSDYGITYCPDSSFFRLYKGAEHMLPTWFKEAITWVK